MTTRVAREASHVPELDGIRGIAILMVLGLHFVCSQIPEPQGITERILARITVYGGWGVDLFFVLSGFLITGILWETRGRVGYFRSFYMRRTLRIFPLYYAILIVLIVLIPADVLSTYAPLALKLREIQFWLWTYLTNVYIARQGSFDVPYVAHFWTLAIEEHFYLVWPLAVGFLSREMAMRVCVVGSALSLGLRLAFGYLGYNPFYAHVLTPSRLDALFIGAWLALRVRGPSKATGIAPLATRGLAAAAAGVLGTSVWHVVRPGDVPPEALRETTLALFCGGLIVLAASGDGPALLKRGLRAHWLGLLGKYSYGLYVYHGIVAYAFLKHRTLPTFQAFAGSHLWGMLLQAAVGTVVSVAIAVASYEFFEMPFLKLKTRFQVSPSAAKPAS